MDILQFDVDPKCQWILGIQNVNGSLLKFWTSWSTESYRSFCYGNVLWKGSYTLYMAGGEGVPWCSRSRNTAQCADSEVRNAFERTPYVVVLKFHVFIHISKSFNFRCALERILRYLTKTWFYTLNFKKNPCWWLSIGYWVIENDSVSDTEECWGMHYCGAPGAWNSAIFWTDDLDPI